jgi:hypothetical protein
MSLIFINPYTFAAADWTPAQLTTAVWLDADDASTVTTVSGNVSQWNDKSGNGRNCVQTNASLRPPYTVSAINSRAAVEFNISSAAGHFLNGLSTGSRTLSSRSMFCVFQETTSVNNAGVFVVAPSSGNDFNQTTAVAYTTTQGVFNFDVVGSTGISYQILNGGSKPTPLGVYGEVFATTTGSLFVNGSLAGTDASFNAFAASSGQGYGVGSRFFGGLGSAGLRGRIGEIVYIDSNLSTLDREKLEGYLAHKWGLTGSLPGGHPYKTAAPTI